MTRPRPTHVLAAGASSGDVVKRTCHVLDARRAPEIGEVRDRHVDGAAPPTRTRVEVRRLLRDDVLPEIETVAAVPRRQAP